MEMSIQVFIEKETGQLMARSNHLKGLLVHGRTYRDLERKLPEAIQTLLEARGHKVLDVKANLSFASATLAGNPGRLHRP